MTNNIMKLPPTPEMEAILAAAKSTNKNLLIQALAGAAKTSTLVRIAHALPGSPILSIAFNKRIATEMAERLPSHCVAKTLNSIGHSAWGSHIGKKLHLDTDKIATIIKNLDLSSSEQELLRDCFGDVKKLADTARLYGYVPEDKYPNAMRLIDKETLYEMFADEEWDGLAWALLDDILIKSITQAYAGTIDFNDQLYMPTLFGAQLPRFPLTLVDEAQDLSPLNHQMVSNLVGTRRIIAVGDSFQSIYGFRGAVSDGMNVLRRKFSMVEFTLSISFRCPKAIIREARFRAPNMKWPDNAADGMVTNLTGGNFTWGPELLPRSCAIICRNNAPLFALGLRLIRAGKSVAIRGMDISKRLIKTMKEFGNLDMDREEFLGHLERWRQAKLDEGKLPEESIEDRFACMRVFGQSAKTLREAIGNAERLFSAEGPIELLSGHKSKGLEWDNVFHLDAWRVPSKYATSPEAKEQEENLRYVITTRAKTSLTYIDLDDFDLELDEPFITAEKKA